jgi:hypothetical protein
MDEFFIPSANGRGGLHFHDRTPYESDKSILHYMVRLTDHELSAIAKVWGGYASQHPAGLFEDMARRWSGWPDEMSWESLEGEMVLRCSHDRLGHISIRAVLRSGPMENDWEVAATVMAEAGQLEDMARRARTFFGHDE